MVETIWFESGDKCEVHEQIEQTRTATFVGVVDPRTRISFLFARWSLPVDFRYFATY